MPARRNVVVPPPPSDFVTDECARCQCDTVWDDFVFRRRKSRAPDQTPYYRSSVCQACHIAHTQVRIVRAQIRHSDTIGLEQALNMLDVASARVLARVQA